MLSNSSKALNNLKIPNRWKTTSMVEYLNVLKLNQVYIYNTIQRSFTVQHKS